MKVLIIEDEELTARKLKRMLGEVESQAEVVGHTTSIEGTVAWLKSNPSPDLVLMDIELSDGQSFEIFQKVTLNSPVIFTTAYDEFAIRAFKVHSIDYLLKPVKEEDLKNALGKLHNLKQMFSPSGDLLQAAINKLVGQFAPSQSTDFRDRFMIKQGQNLLNVGIDEVAYFFSRHKISFIKTYQGQEWMVDYNMDEINNMLDPKRFFRLNRQVIAALPAVKKVNLYFNHKLKIHLQPGFYEEVLVSREKAKDFKTWFGE